MLLSDGDIHLFVIVSCVCLFVFFGLTGKAPNLPGQQSRPPSCPHRSVDADGFSYTVRRAAAGMQRWPSVSRRRRC